MKKPNPDLLSGIIIGIFIGLLCTAFILLINGQEKGDPISINPPPTPAPIKVYISGGIYNPGTYELPKGSRVQDLIEMSGGLSIDPPDTINLASPLYDGQHIHIPVESHADSSLIIETDFESKVNINEATVEELMTLSGIGEVKANDIVQYREDHGPFEKLEDILNVPGIGDHTFEQIRESITISQVFE